MHLPAAQRVWGMACICGFYCVHPYVCHSIIVVTRMQLAESDHFYGPFLMLLPPPWITYSLPHPSHARSIGCTVVEMLTGHPPLHDHGLTQLIDVIRDNPEMVHPHLAPTFSEHVDEFLSECFVVWVVGEMLSCISTVPCWGRLSGLAKCLLWRDNVGKVLWVKCSKVSLAFFPEHRML